MTSRYKLLSFVVVMFTLGACTSSGGAATSNPSQAVAVVQPSVPVKLQPTAVVATPSPEPTASPSPTASSGGEAEASATAGPIDPCTLLTKAEASHLIGATLGAGTRDQVGPNSVCTWAKGMTKLKIFLAPQTDPVQAKAYYESHKGEIPEGAHITELPSLFDGSLIAKGTTPIGTLSGIFVLDGGHFFELYCEFPACSDNALKGGSMLIAGRLP